VNECLAIVHDSLVEITAATRGTSQQKSGGGLQHLVKKSAVG
jgi:hypothetical protein